MSPPRNFSCGLGIFTLGAECSGNGECVYDPILDRGVCQCFEHFNGLSDFQVTSSNTDCQSNLILIRVLWGLNLVITVACFFLVQINMSKLWAKHNSQAKEARSRGGRYTLNQNRGLFANIPFAYVGMPAQIAFAIMKLVDPDQHIGLTWAATILWWVQRSCFYFAGDVFQPSLLTSLLRNQKGLENIVKYNTYFSYLHLFVATGIQVTALPPLLMGVDEFNPVVGLASAGAQLNVYAVAMLFLMFEAFYLKKKVIHILDHSFTLTKDEKTKRIREKLANIQDELTKHAFTQFLVYLVFGVLPFTWRYHDYLLACSWMAVPIAANGLTKSILQDQDKKSTDGRSSFVEMESGGPAAKRVQDQARPTSPSEDPSNDSKPMYVHGLDLEPNASGVSSTADVASSAQSETLVAAQPKESSAKRLLSAFTPSRKNKKGEFFEEEGVGE